MPIPNNTAIVGSPAIIAASTRPALSEATLRTLQSGPQIEVRQDAPNLLDSVGARGMSADELRAKLEANPRFAKQLAAMQAALDQKEAAFELLGDDLNEEQMAQFTQANKDADNILQTMTNNQKSTNDQVSTFARNT